MNPSITHAAKTTLRIAAVALGLAALAPTVSTADALPVRPLDHAIVEVGGGDDYGYRRVFVHGTHGADDFSVTATADQIIVRSINGRPIQAGAECTLDRYRYQVTCPKRGRLHVSQWRDQVSAWLYNADDHLVVKEGARANGVTVEAWGGEGRDVLESGWGLWNAPRLLGGNGDDRLIGSPGTEDLWGGPGNDYIRPGGGADVVDGGHGFISNHQTSAGECAARTHGYFDRLNDIWRDEPNAAEGIDTMDLSNLTHGMLADINICRLTYFVGRETATVVGIEKVIGTRFNDRLVGDDDINHLTGGTGEDWISGEGGWDRIFSHDGWIDTVKCSDRSDTYVMDDFERRLGC